MNKHYARLFALTMGLFSAGCGAETPSAEPLLPAQQIGGGSGDDAGDDAGGSNGDDAGDDAGGGWGSSGGDSLPPLCATELGGLTALQADLEAATPQTDGVRFMHAWDHLGSTISGVWLRSQLLEQLHADPEIRTQAGACTVAGAKRWVALAAAPRLQEALLRLQPSLDMDARALAYLEFLRAPIALAPSSLELDASLSLQIKLEAEIRQLQDQYLKNITSPRSIKHNKKVLLALQSARHRLAVAHGYPTAAHYQLRDTQLQTPERVAAFLDQVIAWTEAILAPDAASASRPPAVPARFPVYLAYEDMLRRLFVSIEEQVGLVIRLQEAPDATWAEDVRVYDVYEADGAVYLGRFSLDVFSRPGKAPVSPRVLTLQRGHRGGPWDSPPEVAMLADWDPRANFAGNPGREFYHEFGHVLDQILAGQGAWYGTRRFSDAIDMVELPSQLLEAWAPENLYASGNCASHLKRAGSVQAMAHEAGLALALGSQVPPFDVQAAVQEADRRYGPLRWSLPINYHLELVNLVNPNGPALYTYLYGMRTAQDVLGVLNTTADWRGMVQRFRYEVLAATGEEASGALLRGFLGREVEDTGYVRWIQGTCPGGELGPELGGGGGPRDLR